METTLYIIKGPDAYRFGHEPVVRLWEPESLSRQWIRRVTVELPEGYEIAENQYGEQLLFKDGEHYELATDKSGPPVIIDHKENGRYIRLPVLSEGWGE